MLISFKEGERIDKKGANHTAGKGERKRGTSNFSFGFSIILLR
jgi:hypothetical protein